MSNLGRNRDRSGATRAARLGAAVVAAAAAGSVIAYGVLIRPWHIRWGATEDEVSATYPGDEIIDRPNINITRAVTIDAAPAAVWQWVVQIGHGRGGFYSYTSLENLFGLDIRNADRIVPELQQLAISDIVKLAPRGSDWVVTRIEPERALVLHVQTGAVGEIVLPEDDYVNSTWGFYLHNGDGGGTRLIVRWRGDWQLKPLSMLAAAFLEPAHFIMERKMLRSIKELAEREGG